jgi:hypothetical protein
MALILPALSDRFGTPLALIVLQAEAQFLYAFIDGIIFDFLLVSGFCRMLEVILILQLANLAEIAMRHCKINFLVLLFRFHSN